MTCLGKRCSGPPLRRLIAALNELAGRAGSAGAASAADRVDDLLADDVDYGYRSYAIDYGYWPAGVPAIRFLARIAAAHPSDAATESAVELITRIVDAPMDRPGASEAGLDAWVDGLRAELRAAQHALAEAARLVPAVESATVALSERGVGYPGSYPPRWRGLAPEVAWLPAWSIKAEAGAGRELLVIGERYFLDPESGKVVAAFSAPRPGSAAAFVDADGPGVLTVAGPPGQGGRRGPLRLWRQGTRGWDAARIGPSLRGVVPLMADDGAVYVGYSDGTLTRRDSRTGRRIGASARVPGPGRCQRLFAYRDGGERRLLAVSGDRMYEVDFTDGRVTELPMHPFRNPATFFREGRRCGVSTPGPAP